MLHRLFAVLLLVAAASVVPFSANAAACSGTSGVTVVVQFPDHIEVGCAPGDPATGFTALKGAGFDVTIVTRFPGAVCQINSYPDTPCDNMPPSSAYWRYYRASPGHDWSPSNYGAASTNPKPGSFEGWRFGSNSPAPDFAIPPAPTPTPKPTPKPTFHPTAAHPTGGASNPVVGPDETPATGTTPAAGTDDPSPTASTSPGPVVAGGPGGHAIPTATGTDVSAVDPPARKAPAESSSGNHSWIWGVLLVGALGAAAATVGVRRRRS